jgi:pimeloyl-ACP methyl ester carboxylesterase
MRTRWSFAAVLVATAACHRIEDKRTAATNRPDDGEAGPRAGQTVELAHEASAESAALAPIGPEPWFTNLSVPAFPDAVVSLPNGATSPRPVVIVLHGSGDRPDWNCDAWRHVTGAHGFVLCPRGDEDAQSSTGADRRYTLRGGQYLRRYVDTALDALGARYAGYVDGRRPIVAGFSLGATEAALLAVEDPRSLPRIGLLEGGQDVWTPERIHRFHWEGGERVLFGCGTKGCALVSKTVAARLEKAGIEAHVVYANVGHTNDLPLQEAIMREIAWFLSDDSRWAALSR